MNLDGLSERRAFGIATIGWVADAFDQQLFALAIPLLLAGGVVTVATAGTIAGASLAAAAIGGTLGGILADRFGRLRVLRGSILLAAIATGAAALAASSGALLVARLVQGLGFGAEWAAGVVLLAEAAPGARRGRAIGAMQSGWAIGWGAALLVAQAASLFAPPATAWRWMFAAGLVPALLAFGLRSGDEAVPPRVAPSPAPRLAAGIVVPAVLIGFGAHGGYHGLFVWLPTVLREVPGLTAPMRSAALLVITIGFATGAIGGGRLSDRLGRRATLCLFAATAALCGAIVATVALGRGALAVLALPLGIAAGGVPAVLAAWLAELFPTASRGTGVGLAYNAGRIASALLPGAIGWLAHRIPLATLVGGIAAAGYATIVLVAPLLPETAGRADETAA